MLYTPHRAPVEVSILPLSAQKQELADYILGSVFGLGKYGVSACNQAAHIVHAVQRVCVVLTVSIRQKNLPLQGEKDVQQ